MSKVAPYPRDRPRTRNPMAEIERLVFIASGYWSHEARIRFYLAVMDRAMAALKVASPDVQSVDHASASRWLKGDHPTRLNALLATLKRTK